MPRNSAFIYNVGQLLLEPEGSHCDFDIDAQISELIEGVPTRGAVVASGRLIRIASGVLTRGRATVDVELQCTRCLEPALVHLCAEFEEEYWPEMDIRTNQSVEKPEDNDSFSITPSHELDLADAVLQNLILAIPMQCMCKDDCAGLCDQCGQNLNTGTCGCAARDIDPRLVKLSKLLDQ